MKKRIYYLIITGISLALMNLSHANSDNVKLFEKIEQNMQGKTQILHSRMVVNGPRGKRIMELNSHSQTKPMRSFVEYTSPARDKGTKMLKIDKDMWIYTPATDRIVMISGHMLRQSVMGSDLSYEDLSETRTVAELYEIEKVATEKIDNQQLSVFELTAKVKDVSYPKQKVWVDESRLVHTKVELYTKSGKLLKTINFSDFKHQDGHWYASKSVYKDNLKTGGGTELYTLAVQFDKKIPPNIFNKSKLKK